MSSWGMKTLQAMEETIQSKPTGCFNKGISRMYSNSLVHILGAIFAAIAFWSGRLCCTLPFVAKLRQHCTKRFCGDSILQLGHIPFSWLRPFSTSDIIVIDNPWDFPSSFTDNLIDTTTSSRQHHLLVDIQGVEGHCAGSVKKVTSATMELIRFFKLSLLSHRCHVRRSNCFFECVGVVREGNVKVSSWPRRGVLLLDFLLLSRSPPHQISVIELLESISKLYAVESVTPTNNNAAHTKPFMKWKYIPRKALSPSADTDGSFKINRPLESRWIQYRQGGFYKKQVSQIAADGGMGTVEKRLQNINRYTYYYEALVHPAMITHDNPQRILLLLSNLVLCDGFVEEILKYNAVVRLVVVADAPEMTECYYSDPALKVAMNNRCFKEDERVEVIYNTRISEWFANTSKDESFDVTFIDRACFVDNLSLLDKISESLGEDGILVTPIGTVSSNYVGPTTPPLYLLEEQRHLEIIAHLEEANFRSIHEYEESRCDRCFLIAMKNIESRARWYRNEAEVNVELNDRLRLPSKEDEGPLLCIFDGATMQSYQVPTRFVEDRFCRHQPEDCLGRNDDVFDKESKNHPITEFEVRNSTLGPFRGCFTKVDIVEKDYLALDDCTHGMFLPPITYELLLNMRDTQSHRFFYVLNDAYVDGYGMSDNFYGKPSANVDASFLTFANHGCNGSYNIGQRLSHTEATLERGAPVTLVYDGDAIDFAPFDPFTERHYLALDCIACRALRSIKAGEEILDNYLTFAGDDQDDFEMNLDELKIMCSGGKGQVSLYEEDRLPL